MKIPVSDVSEERREKVRFSEECFRFSNAFGEFGYRDADIGDVANGTGTTVQSSVVTIVSCLPEAFAFVFVCCPSKIATPVCGCDGPGNL